MDISSYSLYFSAETFTKNSDFISLAEQTYNMLLPKIQNNLRIISSTKELYVPYNVFLECTPDFADIENKLILTSLSTTQILKDNGYDLAHVRTIIMDYENYTEPANNDIYNVVINSHSSNFLPRICNNITSGLCYFSGSVIKSSPVKPFLHFLTYKCEKCKNVFRKPNDETRTKFCKCNKLTLVLNDVNNIISDYREIKLKEKIDIDCVTWCNEPKLGDVIEGLGVVKMKKLGFGDFKKYIDVIFWKSTSEILKPRNDCIASCTDKDGPSDNYDDIVNEEENAFMAKKDPSLSYNENMAKSMDNNYDKQFKLFAKNEKLIDKISDIIFEDIYGYKSIKTALTLAFFGGSIFSQRSPIHILLVGDPGLGKSKLLSKVASVLPKSIYTSSTTSTSAGLTLSCFDNENINAGCVALCNDGVCCIDEFDKLKDPRVLYEVMENESMTYNKGGLYYQANVKVSIIAASNPKGGTFDDDTNIKKNVKFEYAMLNRFDLIFTMVEEFDEKKMRKIIGLPDEKESVSFTKLNSANITNFANKISREEYANNLECDDGETKDDRFDLLDFDMVKRYILYCRDNISPVLSSKAKERLKAFWLEMRKKNCSIQLLLTLKRLTEARAKVNCREVASLKDVNFAIDLYKKTLIIEKKKGKILDDLRERKGDIINKAEIEKMMIEYNVKQSADNYIEKLNYQGIIIKKGKDQYQIA